MKKKIRNIVLEEDSTVIAQRNNKNGDLITISSSSWLDGVINVGVKTKIDTKLTKEINVENDIHIPISDLPVDIREDLYNIYKRIEELI